MEKEVFDQRDMTILIVDDEPRIRDFVRMNLELERYRVLEASNGLEALEQLREHLPDLVVLDVMMPEMDGFETLRNIREVSTVPVIMLTVRQSEQDKIHGLDLGADDYIAKPFSPRELLARVRSNLELARLRQALQRIGRAQRNIFAPRRGNDLHADWHRLKRNRYCDHRQSDKRDRLGVYADIGAHRQFDAVEHEIHLYLWAGTLPLKFVVAWF